MAEAALRMADSSSDDEDDPVVREVSENSGPLSGHL